MTRRLPFRAYWHRRISRVTDPAARLSVTFDYLRAVIRRAPDHAARRAVADSTAVIRRYADDLEAALPEEGR
jgi:hypothetical protein